MYERACQVLLLVALASFVSSEVMYQNDQGVVDNEAEGLRLIVEYRKLLPLQDANKRSDFKKTLDILKQSCGSTPVARSLRLGLNPASPTCTRRCCKVVMPPERQTLFKNVSRAYSWNQSYNTKCGTWGWRRCRRDRTRYDINYVKVPVYHYTVKPCPANKHTCCRDYVGFEGCCIKFDVFRNLLRKMRTTG